MNAAKCVCLPSAPVTACPLVQDVLEALHPVVLDHDSEFVKQTSCTHYSYSRRFLGRLDMRLQTLWS